MPLPLKRLNMTTTAWAGAVRCPWNCTAPCKPRRSFEGQLSEHGSCGAHRVPFPGPLSLQAHTGLQPVCLVHSPILSVSSCLGPDRNLFSKSWMSDLPTTSPVGFFKKPQALSGQRLCVRHSFLTAVPKKMLDLEELLVNGE